VRREVLGRPLAAAHRPAPRQRARVELGEQLGDRAVLLFEQADGLVAGDHARILAVRVASKTRAGESGEPG
jgi:hypothetical protein